MLLLVHHQQTDTNNMKLSFVLLVILLVFFVVETQRGGGGSSRSRSGGSSRGSKSSKMSPESNFIANIFFIGLAIVATIVNSVRQVKSWFEERKRKQERQVRKKLMLDQFQQKNRKNLTKSTPKGIDINKTKDWFLSQKWKMSYRNKSEQKQYTVDVLNHNLCARNESSFDILLQMKDKIGTSKAQGILVHNGRTFEILFEKTYNNRVKAGQTGDFELLLYKGKQKGQQFMGTWKYEGFQRNPDYNGVWTMTPK